MRTELIENSLVERDSKISKLRNSPLSPLCLFCPLVPKNRPIQRDSKFSTWGMGSMGSMGSMGWKAKMENTPVERHSKMCKSSENSPAQRNSKFSNLGNSPLSLFSPFCPLAPQNRLAQRDSKFSNGQLSSIGIRIKTCFLCNYLKINDFFKLFCLGNDCIMLTYRLYSYLEDYNSYQFEIGASRRRIISLYGFLFFGER
jgi:hypothetical protein